MPARFRRLFVTLLAAGATAVPRAQSQDPAPNPTFRARVNAVVVDVSVTGARDGAVTDLQAPDFELKEDGIAQRIETAQFVRLTGVRTSETDDSLPIRSRAHAEVEAARQDVRVFVIFLDEYHVAKDQQLTMVVKKELKAFVRQFGPNDLVAIMDPLTPLTHLRFTRAQHELVARIDAFEGRLRQVHPVRSLIEEEQLRRNDVWELRGAVTLTALESLATYLGGLRDGRKSVLFVSQGPTMGRLESGNEDRLRAVLQAANRGNVTINAFDPRPLGSVSGFGAYVIQRMAHETGGRAVFNSNAPSAQLAQVISDASAHYLLGYVPSREVADGKFHRIEVKVRRRGVRVIARRGYWAPDAKEMSAPAVVDEAQQLAAKAMSALVEPKSGRIADVWVGASRGGDAVTRLTVAWGARTPGQIGLGAAAQVLYIERFPEGKKPGALVEAIETRTVGALEAAAFDVGAGTATPLRLTIRAGDGTTLDRWDEIVKAPAFGADLALATPRFLLARTAAEARRIEAGDTALPVASRRFVRNDQVFVEILPYASGSAAPEITATILNTKGEPIVSVPTTPAATAGVRVRLPLTSLSPATYVLEITARLGADRAQDRIAFRIVP
jgi:VWFA-related protein